MSDQRYEIIENFEKYSIGLDDVFAFKCRSCGKCCRNREDIMLTSRDVYNIATALNLTHEQVIEKYCEVYIGRDSRIPIVRLMPRGVNNVCPLLVGNRCSVHSLKPAVCAMFPIGRVIASEDAPTHMGLGNNPNEIQYIFNGATCGSRRKKQTVRAWLDNFGIPVNDHFFIKWNATIFKLIAALSQYEGKDGITDRAMEMMWGGIFSALYINYDTSKEFYPQFETNGANILSVFENLGIVFEAMQTGGGL